MPDQPERDEEYSDYDDERAQQRDRDEDVPFHLPLLHEDDEDDDTDDLPPMLKPQPRKEEIWDPQRDRHNMPTMPIPREPGSPDPKQTLAGSGGMDPNPDFRRSGGTENTVSHA
ncbi:MAG: hypothetical protein K8J31_05255, partial [Anaerolineae bacterium]|nr:hypothetical protein [Anaerolineae bacterium]